MKKRPVYVDKPVFRLADPNNPVEYRLRQGKWSQMPVEPIEPEVNQFEELMQERLYPTHVSEALEMLGGGLGDALSRVRKWREVRELLNQNDDEEYLPLPPKKRK